MTRVVGVLLAAGAEALVSDDRGSWLLRACVTLRNGGCDDVVVVVGVEAPRARALLGDLPVFIVEAEVMGASLRDGLGAVGEDADAVLVHLVDQPDVGPEMVARMIRDASPDALARAVYAGQPGHPVLVGRDHWKGVLAGTVDDYLVANGVLDVEGSPFT